MSNLKLPTMTFKNLAGYWPFPSPKHIAYATTAEYVHQDGSTDSYVVIRHHGTTIAEIAHGWVFVTNAGYHSQTTRQRIHRILTDNKQDYGFLVLGQDKGDQVLSFRGIEADYSTPTAPDRILPDRQLTRSFYSAHWDFENREVQGFLGRQNGNLYTVTL